MESVLLAFTIVGVLILLARTMRDANRLENLEWKVKKLALLDRRITELEETLSSSAGGPNALEESSAHEPIHPSVQSQETASPEHAARSREFPAGVPASAASPVQVRPSRTREEWEQLIGGQLLNRIGALALTIALGSFLKYAFDNNWISESVRVVIGAFIGFLCLGGGYATKRKGFEIFAQGLVGAGIAILYLSVYASFNFYALVPQWVAFMLMASVTVLAFISALYFDSLAEALLGWVGGFLTPLLLNAGTPNEVGLFGYIALLDAGIIAIVLRKEAWQILEPLTFLGTWLMYLMWYDQNSNNAALWTTIVFVTIFWMLFLILDVVRPTSAKSRDLLYHVVPGLNAAIYFLSSYSLLNVNHHAWAGLMTVMIGVVYAAILFERSRRETLDDATKARYGLTAVWLAVIATSIQFTGVTSIMFWSVEAAALLWLTRQWPLRYMDVSALMIFVIALLMLCGRENGLVFTQIDSFIPIVNQRAAAFALLAASLWAGSAVLLSPDNRWERRIFAVLHYGWSVTVLLLLTAETNDYFRWISIGQSDVRTMQLHYFLFLTLGSVWMLYSLPLTLIGLRMKSHPLMVIGSICLLFAVVFGTVSGFAYAPIDTFTPVGNYRALTLVVITAALMVQSRFIAGRLDWFEWLTDALLVVRVAILLVIFILLTGETRDFFQKDIVALTRQNQMGVSHESLRNLNLQQMLISGIWLLYSAVLMGVGLWRKYRELRLAAITLFGFSIVKIFIYDLSFLETLYRIFSFLALGLILLAVSYAYQKYKNVILEKA